MTTIASQITSLTVVYSIVYSGADQRKHQSSASLAFVWGIHRDRWTPRTKGQLRGKCVHLITSSWISQRTWLVVALNISNKISLGWNYQELHWWQVSNAAGNVLALSNQAISLANVDQFQCRHMMSSASNASKSTMNKSLCYLAPIMAIKRTLCNMIASVLKTRCNFSPKYQSPYGSRIWKQRV